MSKTPVELGTTPAIPLTQAAAGARVRLVGIEAGMGLVARLAAMGLVRGVELRVVSSRGRGPVVVEVLGTRVALGHGMAAKIVVR